MVKLRTAKDFSAVLSPALPLSPLMFVLLSVFMVSSTRGGTDGGILQHNGTFIAWLWLTTTAPVLLTASWIMLQKMHGLVRYWGHWIRLSADMSMMFAVMAFDVTRTSEQVDNIWFRAVVVVGLLSLVLRDIWRIFHIERAAVELAREDGKRLV